MINVHDRSDLLVEDTFKVFSSYHRIYLSFISNFDAFKYPNARSITMNFFLKDGRNKVYVPILEKLDRANIQQYEYDVFFMFMHTRVFEVPEYYLPNQVFFDKGLEEWPSFCGEVKEKGRDDIERKLREYGKCDDITLYREYKKGELSLVDLLLFESMGKLKHLEDRYFYKNIMGKFLKKMKPFFLEKWNQDRRR